MIEENYEFCCISEFFVDPTGNGNYKRKQNSEKIKRIKISLNLTARDISLGTSSNFLYFNFAKSH